jgi:hypothetical protein
MSTLKNNGLLLANLVLFLVFLGGMTVSGWQVYNDEQVQHGSSAVTLGEYVATGEYGEAVFENWESEVLQMGAYVVLTAYLFQRGSSESKPLDKPAPQDADPRRARITSATPWPVRRGGWVLRIYERSSSSCCSSHPSPCTLSRGPPPTAQSRPTMGSRA